MRIIFFAGKGGVGKTSAAAATGIKASEMGYKTVILSLDIAHSLSDIFDTGKNLMDQNRGKPVSVGKNLWIQELDIQEEIQQNWGEIHSYLAELLSKTGLDDILAEELAILPGMEEVSLLLYINRYFREGPFDVMILDCAPTGESIRFISIPTTLDWYMKKIFKFERSLAKMVRPVAKRVYDIPIPGDGYFSAIAHLFERLKGVDKILIDPDITSVRLVTNPEKIVLKETQRAFMYFSLYKMNIDGIMMNRIIPDDVADAYFSSWKKNQKFYIEKAKTYFSPIPIFSAPLFQEEVLGYDRLRVLADRIYAGKNPLDRLFSGEPYQLVKHDHGYQMRIKLPFVEKKQIDLKKSSDELIIRLGGFKRHLLLPRQVAAASSVKASLKDNTLYIQFKGDAYGQKKI